MIVPGSAIRRQAKSIVGRFFTFAAGQRLGPGVCHDYFRGPGSGMAANMTTSPYCIAYLGRILPVISETFVVREIAALRRLGAWVKVFSLHPPETGVSHPEAPDLAREVGGPHSTPQPPLLAGPPAFCPAVSRGATSTAFTLTSSPPPGPGGPAAAVWPYFMVAPFAAWRLRRAGIQHLHAHFANAPASVALMAAALAGISFSFTAHAYDIFIDQLLLPAKLAAAAFVACISQYNLRYLRGTLSRSPAGPSGGGPKRSGYRQISPPPPPPGGRPPASSPWDAWWKPRGFTSWWRPAPGCGTRACPADVSSSGLVPKPAASRT